MNPPLLPSIGDRPLSLAAHLRQTAYLLTTAPSSYKWTSQEQCNCGLLARSVTGLTSERLFALISPMLESGSDPRNTWTQLAARYCPLTGQSQHEIFAKLTVAGLDATDFAHLEYLTHPELRAATRVQLWGKRHKTPAQVARYCAAWAEAIETYRAAHPEAASAPTDAQLDAIEARPLVAAS